MITLAAAITESLQRKGTTQAALAARANISQSRLSELAAGKGLPRRRGIPDLAAAIGFDVPRLAEIIAADRRRMSRRRKAGAA